VLDLMLICRNCKDFDSKKVICKKYGDFSETKVLFCDLNRIIILSVPVADTGNICLLSIKPIEKLAYRSLKIWYNEIKKTNDNDLMKYAFEQLYDLFLENLKVNGSEKMVRYYKGKMKVIKITDRTTSNKLGFYKVLEDWKDPITKRSFQRGELIVCPFRLCYKNKKKKGGKVE